MNALRELIISNFKDAAIIDNFRIGANGELYKRDGCICLGQFDSKVRGAVSDSDTVYVVSGDKFYTIHDGTVSLKGTLEESVFSSEDEKVTMFVYANKAFVLGGNNYYRYDKDTGTFGIVEGYAPIIDTVDSTNISETIIESCNLLTSTVRKRLTVISDQAGYETDEDAAEVNWVKIDGVLLSSDEYYFSILTGPKKVILANSSKYSGGEGKMEIEFTLKPTLHIPDRMKFFGCTKSFVFETESGPVLLLYGNDSLTPGLVLYSHFPADPTDSYGALDYFIKGHEFTIGDGTKQIRTITRWGERVVVVTSEGIYELTGTVLSNGYMRFSTSPIVPEIGTSEYSGAVAFEDRLYLANENGLFSVSYNSITSKYETSQIEIDPRFIASRSDYKHIKLHINRSRSELWCCLENTVGVYNIKYGVWYHFSGFNTDILFSCNSATAFSSGKGINLFDEGAYDDAGVGFDAVIQSKNINFDNVFSEKTIYGFGAAFERRDGAILECTIENNKGNVFSVAVESEKGGKTSPVVSSTHARLGNSAYIIYRLISPSYAAPANVREIMLRYRVGGGA